VYTGTDGIKSSATTARALAAASPFLANGVLYTGEKVDSVVKIDLGTGALLEEFGGGSSSSPLAPTAARNESILLLGRTDFHIRAFDATSGLEQVILGAAATAAVYIVLRHKYSGISQRHTRFIDLQ
jgi:hypothetical protein